ncbi:MAG: hypothetical protein K8R86_11845 [Bacteroidales bacterium]|nr:hypothetical protein [Bacteroidales bacterium]
MPGNQNLMLSDFDEATANITKIEFRAILSSTEREDRIVEIIKEFAWKTTPTDRHVDTEVKDLTNTSGGKNSLHTAGASQY